MKKLVYFAIMAAAASSAAVAKDFKQDMKAAAPTVAATQMTDSEMDKVTAGAGYGLDTANGYFGPGQATATPQGDPPTNGRASGWFFGPGFGTYTRF